MLSSWNKDIIIIIIIIMRIKMSEPQQNSTPDPLVRSDANTPGIQTVAGSIFRSDKTLFRGIILRKRV